MAQNWTLEDLIQTKAFQNECKRIGWTPEQARLLFECWPLGLQELHGFAARIGKSPNIVLLAAKRFNICGDANPGLPKNNGHRVEAGTEDLGIGKADYCPGSNYGRDVGSPDATGGGVLNSAAEGSDRDGDGSPVEGRKTKKVNRRGPLRKPMAASPGGNVHESLDRQPFSGSADSGADSGNIQRDIRRAGASVHGRGAGTANARRGGTSWNHHINRGWCEELGFFYRSWWERNYAFYLEWLKKQGNITKWEYEPKTFWFEKIKRGTNSYKPDFRITLPNGQVEYHEVKGRMTQRSATALKRMAMYHPDVKVIVIDKKSYKAIKSKSRMIPGWRTHATHVNTGRVSPVPVPPAGEKTGQEPQAPDQPGNS